MKILASFLLVTMFSTTVPCEEFVLGYITGSQRLPGDAEYSRPGLTISGAISLAVKEVNDGILGSRGHKLRFEIAETYGDEIISIKQTASLWTQNISAYIGPQETCVHEGRMAAAFNLPMISYFCTDNETSNKNNFPTFARTRPPDAQISKSVASVLLAFNWTQVAFLYHDAGSNEYQKVATTIISTLESYGVMVRFRKSWKEIYYFHNYFQGPFRQLVEETYHDIRIYVILGIRDEHLGLMVAMEEMKLFEKGEYWVVGVDLKQYDEQNPEKHFSGDLSNNVTPIARRAFRSYFGVMPTPPIGFENFTIQVNYYMERDPFNFKNPAEHVGGMKMIPAEAAYLYDAVHLYARALLEVLDMKEDPRNGTAIINAIRGRYYQSAMGYLVYIDENGDAMGNYTLLSRQAHHTIDGEYGLYPAGMLTIPLNGSRLPELHMNSEIDWISGKPPISEPPCGFSGEKCITHTAEIAGGITGALLFVMAVVSLGIYRNWRYEQELDSLLWKVDYKDIQMNEENTSLGTKISRAIYPLIRTSQVSLSSNPDFDFRYSTIYTPVGIYKGRLLAIKKVRKKSIDITRSMKKELKLMRDLRHDNLNAFIGACTDPPNICIVTEYCTRGSLKDILENEDVKLDNMFIASLVGDIIRGMMFLHDSPVRFHGNLKCSNCLVDSRWVVKIADFGLHEFKRPDTGDIFDCPLQDETRTQRSLEGLLYKAPELLRAIVLGIIEPPLDARGTQKGDVYSFGIILYELHTRHGPFGDTGMSPQDILHRVIHLMPGSRPFRPQLELETSFTFVRECLQECWAECPEDRPDFKTVRTKLRPLRKGMKPNIFDNMMAMMEKYANNLEVLVDERTDQLVEEKKKTEALLYEMLPRTVAEQLKRGNKVEAESFDCVTIYFSDIEGFTSMSAESTPLQVVNFLNDLYTCFDSIIENYDVYKVETIGDAYMVVSGLPIRNGTIHAGEIASMSLHLLDAVKMFRIRHRPTDNLMLRIGIHSGPVCAGVVGLKMPRYCLFGDTVNTASRMESTGEALKIHCSLECKAILDTLGGYKLTERGMVSMKGKGEKLTFWLQDEDFDKRRQRDDERALRRCKSTGKQSKSSKTDSNGYPCGVPRSSLKNKCNNNNNIMPRSPLSRCSSLESPKRLRFASGNMLELHQNQQHRVSRDPLLEMIVDNSPSKKKSSDSQFDSSVSPDTSVNIRKNSNSCPCIENIPGDSLLQHSQRCLSRFDEEKNSSAPLLLLNLVAGLGNSDASSPQCNGVSSSPMKDVNLVDISCDETPLLISPPSENEKSDRETPV